MATSDDDTVEARAAFWFARHGRGSTGADDRQFTEWLNAAPENAQAYLEHQRVWAELELVADHPRMSALRRDALGIGSIPEKSHPSSRRIAGFAAGLAAACIAVVATAMVWGPGQSITPVENREIARHQTLPGQRLTVALADRSELTLAPSSEVEVVYGERTRHVRLLGGRAFFAVARDADRPFSVQAQDRTVTALGTRFQVALETEFPEVVLIDGVVEVAGLAGGTGAPVYRLRPGERLTGALSAARVARTDVDTETAWRSGQLVFRDQPLKDVVAEFTRYAPEPIRVVDARAGEVRVSGVFQYEQVGAFAAALERSFGLHVERAADGAYLVRAGHETR